MLSQILTTRLQAPRLRRAHVPRPLLTARLNAGLHRQLTLLRAPAGFGKTTLLSEWVAGSQLPVAWLSLGQDENSPEILLDYLIASLQTIHPALEIPVSIDQITNEHSSFQSILITLINEIADLATPIILVLDDYHVIGNKLIHEIIAFLLENLPQRMHLIIASRSEPSLPLARLRSRGQMNELCLDDLHFTFNEALSFLQNSVKNDLSTEHIMTLYGFTEGWIDGLRMAANSLQALPAKQYESFIAEFTSGNRDTVDYFIEEVLNRQPEHWQNFLLQTSILERLNGSLCEAVTGDVRAQEILKSMEKSDLFVIPLDRHGEQYRYHNLFVKLLVKRLVQFQPDRIPELHRRASRWYEGQGLLTEAVKHALAAQDWQRSRHLIDTNAKVMATETQIATLNRWLEALSAEVDFPEAKGWGEYTSDIGEVLSLLPENQSHHDGLRALTIGRAYLALGQVCKAEEVLTGIDLTGPDFNHAAARITLISILGEMRRLQGKLHLAAATYQPFLELIDEQMPAPLYSKFYGGLIHLYYEWNQLDDAQLVVDLCFQRTKRVEELHSCFIENYQWQANVLLAAGNEKAANQAMKRALALTHKVGTPVRLRLVMAHQARLWLQQNNLRDAEQWVKQCGLTPQDSTPYSRQFEYITVARVLIAQGRVEQAVPLLTRMLEMAEATDRAGDVIELLALRALAYQVDGLQASAFADIANALCQAERERYIRIFVDAGAPMATLLQYAATQGVTLFYVKSIMDAFGTSLTEAESMPSVVDRAHAKTNALIEPLSTRELEVLCLVATGQSNREVAAELVIAPTTVKKHLSNIFGKLGVKNRTQAAAEARDIGLI